MTSEKFDQEELINGLKERKKVLDGCNHSRNTYLQKTNIFTITTSASSLVAIINMSGTNWVGKKVD